jgi:hypothetical protein
MIHFYEYSDVTLEYLERGPLSLVSTSEELLDRKSSGSGLESREYGSTDTSRWPRGTIYPQNLALISPTSGGRSIGIVRSRTQATELTLVATNIEHMLTKRIAMSKNLFRRRAAN